MGVRVMVVVIIDTPTPQGRPGVAGEQALEGRGPARRDSGVDDHGQMLFGSWPPLSNYSRSGRGMRLDQGENGYHFK